MERSTTRSAGDIRSEFQPAAGPPEAPPPASRTDMQMSSHTDTARPPGVACWSVTPASLHQEHYRDLVRMAALMTDSRTQAEDIVQDAFAELFARWSSIDRAKALHYLRRSVANGSKSALRKRRTDRRWLNVPVADAPAADDRALRAAGHQSLLDAIGRLPSRQREVLVLRYYSGLSIAETAAALGIRPTAVTASTHRALRALMLEKENIR